MFEKISNVTAEADQNELVEFNNSVTLTCSASGTLPSFRWFNRSTIVTGSDRVLLDKRNLTILNVTRYDDGPFQCEVSNNVSDRMSTDVNLTIHYGPDSSVVSVTPEALIHSGGSDIILSCSSESYPAAQFQWALNGTLLAREGPELRLENVQDIESGAYSCWAYNSKTQRYKASSPTNITVIENISNVTAKADQNELVEFNNSVTLTCSASGTLPSFQWLNRSTIVTGSDRVLLDKRSLTILKVTRYDDGPFKCEVWNSVSNQMSSDVDLTIHYGPDSSVVSVTPEAPFYSAGSDITLSCSSESFPAAQFQWALNGTLLAREGPELRLENVQDSESGAYSCWAYNIKTQRYKASSPQSITVIEKISNVTAEANQNELAEFNNSVILTCSASGTLPSFRWLNRSTIVTGSDRVLLDKRSLTILNVTRYEKWPFNCNVSNTISYQMSSDVNLTIHYGPDSSVVSVSPEAPFYSAGSNITLSCSSESYPAAQFQWALNGTLLGREGPELRLENVQDSESGAYSCWAYNSKTKRYKASSPQSITVIEKISNVTAEANQNELAEFNNSVTLTCSASGTLPSFRWLNRSTIVTGSDRVLLDKMSLTILNVTRYDDGPFQCNVSNTISYQMSSDVNLTIHYGPDSFVVSVSPEAPFYSAGSNITLSCSSESYPAAQFQWALNGTLLGREGPELRLENVQDSESGAYSCWAFNSKTQRYKASSPQSIIVIEKISNVTAEANQNELAEFNNSVTLTCSSSGTLPSFRWFNRSTIVTGSDRVLLDKMSLTILNVTRYDDGPFQCNVSNTISYQMSSDVNLTIHYGPDSSVVSVTPEASIYSAGSDITLSCSSESNPTQFHWALNGSLLGKKGRELRLEKVQTSESGAYSCWAYNSKTQRYKASSPTIITVIVPKKVKMVRVKVQAESGVNMEDPAVQAAILEKIGQRLWKTGKPAGTKLTWIKQQNEKIFQKINEKAGREKKRAKINEF
ncbi:hypothetical protein AALO_G00173940 [Alosa alosa]|uniref:Ig-like domain-containing protein n=3 Tax=Alosa alosa TaxID=278164 RepID=A0AAV6G732_9TELE|nr:hypothetical protein AALO_G00173940 [Alosa alosa]